MEYVVWCGTANPMIREDCQAMIVKSCSLNSKEFSKGSKYSKCLTTAIMCGLSSRRVCHEILFQWHTSWTSVPASSTVVSNIFKDIRATQPMVPEWQTWHRSQYPQWLHRKPHQYPVLSPWQTQTIWNVEKNEAAMICLQAVNPKMRTKRNGAGNEVLNALKDWLVQIESN